MWSVQFIGQPDAIKRALIVYGNALEGESKQEFNAALPVLESLVGLTTDETSLAASGNGRNVSVILMKSNALYVR